MIWGQGLAEWQSSEKWKKSQTKKSAPGDLSQWWFRSPGLEWGPLSFSQLIEKLKSLGDFSKVEIKDSTNLGWRDLYSVVPVIDALGLSRRRHPRVPIAGQVTVVEGSSEESYKLLSISEGGLGFSSLNPPPIGEVMKVLISSPNLSMEINATIEVVYTYKDGTVGTQFTSLSQEAQGLLIAYAQKFSL